MKTARAIRLSLLLIALSLFTACKKKQAAEKNTDVWFKDQLIYNLDVKTFQDSDTDGVGDFNGLTSRLDYLKNLGVTMIWLAPFQPSPGADDGYDITDYYSIDKHLGTKNDFQAFMSAARHKGIHVIMDLVLNHSSAQHPWFIKASSDTDSYRHNWYLWSQKRPKDWNKGMGFPGVDKDTWAFDSTAKEYYFHRFYPFEPDLNYQNPAVIKESEKILGYWLSQGMEGFRLDAVPFIIDDPRESTDKPKFDFNMLHQLAGYVKKLKPDAVLLGEANVEPEENKSYFSKNGDGLDMMFNFYANEFLFYGFATGDVGLFKEALQKTKDKPGADQWAYFLRNHDEIDIGRLNDRQKGQVYKRFGPDSTMKVYKRGIRRRLATMFGDDPQHLRMAYSLLFSLPGTPVIRYGEEIGMGDDLSLHERLSVRTPMQWDRSANSGFSKFKTPFRPIISGGEYGYQMINVAKEKQQSGSLYNSIKKVAALRKKHPGFGDGQWKILDAGSENILVIQFDYKGEKLIACYNFSEQQQTASIKLPDNISNNITELISAKNEHLPDSHQITVKLNRYDYKWYRLY